MKNQVKSFERNGVSVEKVGSKWHLTMNTPTNGLFTKIVSGRLSDEKAGQIATAMSASKKRGFVGNEPLDPMAQGQIRRIIAARTFKGPHFAHTVPTNTVASRRA